MRLEIPTCSRCCFCVPLRYGIIISGYLNLLSSLLVVAVETSVSVQNLPSPHTLTMYKGVTFYCQVWFTAILYASEILFSIILIVGAHMKKMSLLRVFYYYSITTTTAVMVVFLVVQYDDYYKGWGHYIFEFSLVLCIVVFQINLLLLIRTQLKKSKDRTQLTFVNHVSEMVIDGTLPEGSHPL